MEVSPEKLNELIYNVQNLVGCLNRQRDIDLHRNIDQFYYMQKLEELKILKSQREAVREPLPSVDARIARHYHEIAAKWSKDISWMNTQNKLCQGEKI